MHSFQYTKPKTLNEALAPSKAAQKFIAGGTTLVDLMKLEVETPQLLVDLAPLDLKRVERLKDGSWEIGATVTNSDLAHHKEIQAAYPVLSEAILAGASVQLRNKATTGGNLLQRTRCVYFRDPSKACNKRTPNSGCSALEGHNRNLAVLGTSESCIATNPSDMNVALAALEATVQIQSTSGTRSVDFQNFHLLPGKTPHIETVVQPGELITSVTLPKLPEGAKSAYLKLRDRASYEFALASIAVVASMKQGRIERIRFAMGGVGTKPWRVSSAEALLEGEIPGEALFKKAAEEFLKGAKGYSENAFKIDLARLCFIKGLKDITMGKKA